MATELNIVHGVRITGYYAGPAGLSAPKHQINFERTNTTAYGSSGAGRASKLWQSKHTYGGFIETLGVGPATLDKDVYNDSIGMASVKGLIITENTAVSGNGVFINGSFFNAAVGNITNYLIGPNGALVMSNPSGWTASVALNLIGGIRQSNDSEATIVVWGN